jgi:hypothetical protein
MSDGLAITSLIISLVLPIVVFMARHWIVARITKGVQHQFDERLEKVRADLRRTEELLKSELRDKEAAITALRNNVLSGSAGRQALLDKRRFEAVQKVWTSVNDLAAFKGLSATVALMKVKAIAREANNPKMQEFLSIIGGKVPDMENFQVIARDERPFLPELAWAYLHAYSVILFGNYARYKVLKLALDVDGPDKYIEIEASRKILKAVLPHQSKWIDEHEPNQYHYLLDEIESLLLAGLRKILEGQEADQAGVERARAIDEAIRQAEEQRTEQAVPNDLKS